VSSVEKEVTPPITTHDTMETYGQHVQNTYGYVL
jgi:hypothetical protein